MASAMNKADPNIFQAVSDDMAHCAVPVRSDMIEAHALVLTRLAQPGTWWTGSERIAIAAESRAANSCAFCAERKQALSPYTIKGTHATHEGSGGVLPEAIIDIIHLATTDAPRMTARAIEKLSDDGLSDAHYVEALGILVALRSMDQTCRGLGVPLHALPKPVPGEPSRNRPEDAGGDEAFVPMLPDQKPLPPNDDLWGERSGNVIRAMSLVPDAVRDLLTLSDVHYLPSAQIMEFDAGRALSRAQIELLAGRVSAINDCFY